LLIAQRHLATQTGEPGEEGDRWFKVRLSTDGDVGRDICPGDLMCASAAAAAAAVDQLLQLLVAVQTLTDIDDVLQQAAICHWGMLCSRLFVVGSSLTVRARNVIVSVPVAIVKRPRSQAGWSSVIPRRV